MASKISKLFSGIIRKSKNRNSTAAPNAIYAEESEESFNISMPTNVKHEMHVGFDSATGQIKGLPPVWLAWLNQSDIRLDFLVCIIFKNSL